MTEAAKLISTKDDFPNVYVWMKSGKDGFPVFMVDFVNHKFSVGAQIAVAYLWGPVAIIGGTFALFYFIALAQEMGVHWSVPTVIIVVGLGALLGVLAPPHKRREIILIDMGRDLIRASGEERKLSRLKNLTIEQHPKAEWERQQRRGELGPFQKQHCLVGWFGAGGAEQVQLACRYEWPRRESLFEVRQAILWAIEQAQKDIIAPEGAADEKRRAAGIRPPLDQAPYER